MTSESIPIDEFKKKFKVLKEKYDLPEFTKLNETFDIEDIDIESEFLLRKIRRAMSEKIASYLRFAEMILNPSNTPLFFFNLVKKLNREDSENLGKIYEKLGNFEIEILSLDLEYSEKKEAEFINRIYTIFNNEVKGNFLKIIEKLNNGEAESQRINGSYLG